MDYEWSRHITDEEIRNWRHHDEIRLSKTKLGGVRVEFCKGADVHSIIWAVFRLDCGHSGDTIHYAW